PFRPRSAHADLKNFCRKSSSRGSNASVEYISFISDLLTLDKSALPSAARLFPSRERIAYSFRLRLQALQSVNRRIDRLSPDFPADVTWIPLPPWCRAGWIVPYPGPSARQQSSSARAVWRGCRRRPCCRGNRLLAGRGISDGVSKRPCR